MACSVATLSFKEGPPLRCATTQADLSLKNNDGETAATIAHRHAEHATTGGSSPRRICSSAPCQHTLHRSTHIHAACSLHMHSCRAHVLRLCFKLEGACCRNGQGRNLNSEIMRALGVHGV